MKKIITFSFLSFTALFFIVLGGSQSSCAKDTDCTVDIYVDSTNAVSGINAPVAGATVYLYANINPPGQVQATGTTDNSGHVHFDFKLPAIFDIKASKGALSGTGLIQLQVGGNATQTVLIK